MPQRPNAPSEAVIVEPANDGGWAWSVVGRSSVVVRGEARDPASAWRTGSFAAGAVDAFFRLRQRRF